MDYYKEGTAFPPFSFGGGADFKISNVLIINRKMFTLSVQGTESEKSFLTE